MKRNPQLLATFQPNIKLAVAFLTAWATVVDGRSVSVEKILNSWLDRFADISGLHDAYHLSLAEHSGAQTFVTGDNDFKQVKSLPAPMYLITL